MSQAIKRRIEAEAEPVRVLGRGLRAQKGVHLTMRTLREAAGKTQVDVAEGSGIDQADVSRLESRESFEDCQVSTLQRYVAALGGRLDLVASFGNKKIVLTGVQPGSSAKGTQAVAGRYPSMAASKSPTSETGANRGGWKTCSRGHKYRGPGPCPICWPGRLTGEKKGTARKAESAKRR